MDPAAQTLDEVCKELHRRLDAGEAWDRPLWQFLIEQPAVIARVRCLASRIYWFDKRLKPEGCEHLANQLLAEAWFRLPKLRLQDVATCAGRMTTFLRRSLLRIPEVRQRRRHPEIGPEHKQGLEHFYAVARESLLQQAIARLPIPLNILVRLRLKHPPMTQAAVGEAFDWPVSKVRQAEQQAHALLKDLIEELYENDE